MGSVIFRRAAEEWAEMRSDYESHVQHAYAQAVEGTCGVLVNKNGRAEHIDGYDLFTGPRVRAHKYASEELIEWWKSHPRLSLEEFERRWLEGYERIG